VIDLARVQTFLAVVQAGGFREAAKRTGLSQPAVSQHVQQLERSLNARLIDRSHAGSTLTAQGQAFLPFATSLLRTWARVEALFQQKPLVVGASSNTGIYLLQPWLKAWQEREGEMVDIAIDDNLSVASSLENCQTDVAVMEWWDGRPGYCSAVWRREPLVMIVPPDHPWAGKRRISRREIARQPMLGGEAATGTATLLRHYLGQDPVAGPQLGSTEAVKHAVAAGLGVSLVLEAAVEHEVRRGALRALPVEGRLEKEIHVIWREVAQGAAPGQRFAQFLLNEGSGQQRSGREA
jgi:DNA-binding transcriptional LysR family regulator